MIIVVHNKTPFNTLQDLITYAKANPDKLFNASSGNGSSPHLASALFESTAGVKFATIQFKGGGAAAQSTIVGDTQVMFATPATVMGFLKSGMLRAISLTSAKRSDAIPGIPSALEGGLKNYNMDFSYGIYVPKGTPDVVIKRLFDATTKGLLQAGVKERFAVQGLDISPSKSTEDFIAELKQEAPSIYRAVKESGAKVE
jgi:tripartite-type tricarboxylate transporter receptor subunit TctC